MPGGPWHAPAGPLGAPSRAVLPSLSPVPAFPWLWPLLTAAMVLAGLLGFLAGGHWANLGP